MKQLVRLRMRPSRDGSSFRYMLDYVDRDGRRRWISLGHTDERRAEHQRYEKELELRVNATAPMSMRFTDFFQDSLKRTKGQIRATTLEDMARAMKDFVECIGDIDVQDVRYEHGERFIQYCLEQNLTAGTTTKKVKQLKRVFQLAEDRGQLDRHPLRRLKPPKVRKRKIRVFSEDECLSLYHAARPREERGSPVRWELLIRMGPGTDRRRGKLMNATWRDVDFPNMTIGHRP